MRDREGTADEGLLARLRAGLSYTGTTEYGSCIQQATTNVLEAQGLRGAADLIGTSWGFGYQAGDVRLRAGERWLPAAARLSGLDITRLRPGSAEAASDLEQAALADGVPAVVAVDSYDIPSPYQGTTHLMHALILVGADADTVTVLDPMNRPEPARMNRAAYRHSRGSAVVAGYDLIVSRGSVDRPVSAVDAVGELYADAVARHEADLDEFDRFIRDVEAGRVAPDVADVAAERTYAHRLLAAAGRERPELKTSAAAMDTLARRWYFAHTIAMEGGAGASGRMPKILRALREREIQVLDEFADTVRAADLAPAGAAEVPPGLSASIRSVLESQTSIAVEGLGPDDNLWSAGLTSLESVRAMMAIEDELRLEFPPSLLSRATFESLSSIERAVVAVLTGSADDVSSNGGTR
ncbi:phosphopantetheine-binding protein [Streptomyces sp. XH2]|uniref:phosphopantetheine-binding protein n=1 Tax=Streptomyces sp. XH2 TaxID=3412483 RepID=UPI003C7DBE96